MVPVTIRGTCDQSRSPAPFSTRADSTVRGLQLRGGGVPQPTYLAVREWDVTGASQCKNGTLCSWMCMS